MLNHFQTTFVVLLTLNIFWGGLSYAEHGPELSSAIRLLSLTPTGQALLNQAEKAEVPMQIGSVSKTEITATRETRGQSEELKFHSQVLISNSKSAVFQALDLAHELTHAVHPKKNPFDPHLNAEQYIRHGIESDGGEAKAIAQECQVGKELIETQKIKEETVSVIKARCQFAWKSAVDSNAWKKSFYQLGSYYQQFMKTVGKMKLVLQVEPMTPLFSSAVTHKPYPVALLEEYIQITKTICERARSTALGRQVASLSTGLGMSGLENRCNTVDNSY